MPQTVPQQAYPPRGLDAVVPPGSPRVSRHPVTGQGARGKYVPAGSGATCSAMQSCVASRARPRLVIRGQPARRDATRPCGAAAPYAVTAAARPLGSVSGATHSGREAGHAWCGTVCGRDAAVEPTGTYLRRVPQHAWPTLRPGYGALPFWPAKDDRVASCSIAHTTCSRTSSEGCSDRARNAASAASVAGPLPSATARLRSQRSWPRR